MRNSVHWAVSRPLMVEITIGLSLTILLSAGLVLAQNSPSHKLQVGQSVSGSLDATIFAQTYTFDAQSGDIVTVSATSQTKGLSLALLLAGSDGNVLGQSVQANSNVVTLKNLRMPSAGTYFITVLRASGVQGNVNGDYNLTLSATASSTSGKQVSLPNGLSFSLSWTTQDYLSLEVRDPIGGDIHRHNASAPSGGQFGADANADCASATTTPTDNINWPGGNVPSGSYEIIVYYLAPCSPASTSGGAPQLLATGTATTLPKFTPTLAAVTGGGDVSFTVNVTVNGDTLQGLTGTLKPNQQYVGSLLLSSPDQSVILPGGVLPPSQPDLSSFADKIANPTPLNGRTSITGTIAHTNPADAWSYTLSGSAKSVTIAMSATSGSLDAFLVLLGPDGNIIASNNDANGRTLDAEIANETLQPGTYTIVATRFAQELGGTEGNYTLTIHTGTQSVTRVAATTPPSSAIPTTLPSGSIEISLTWNSRADLRLLVRDPAGVSVYSDNTSPNNSGILDRMGNFRCTNATTSPVTYIYWPSNLLPPGTYEVNLWMQSRCADTNILPQYTLSVNINGKQVINSVNRPDPNLLHSLTTFTVDSNGNATAGPSGIIQEQFTPNISDQIGTATPLSYGVPVSGTIDATHAYQLYRFTASKGDKVTLAMRNSSGTLDTNLFLLDPNAVQINANNDTSGKLLPAQIKQTIPTDGTYIVVATRYGVQYGGTSGTFDLSITQGAS